MPQATPRIRYVGLDVHKETITVAVAEEAGQPQAWGTISNDSQAVRRLVRQLGREGCQLLAIPLTHLEAAARRRRGLPVRSTIAW